ncbi:class I SAM-dependent methyltransferase [Candidatus Poribacteria bacterium]|jgi:SAM-dependent methyltransferase|nr:class I SAM-dependent methyltransferase [Candidatus Poribacteria bacterium]MBT5534891.1 class I SAM-dependent methyltransferase [Candidatus Poribacteria bacterium]MBT5715143.1 class I SAM-dependent methyltransferase [Candidatus Poribacteria bacterium]MBT7807396.1 class I SAM-dependent methyltransferase [Candidatus Poribacteria bacterium]
MADHDAHGWYEDDEFWTTMEPLLFPEERIAKADEEVEQVAALIDLPGGSAVLDLCCGVGRHSAAFARLGHAVTGVDRTTAFLASARERAAGLDVEFVHGDMRDFRREGAFDAAVSLFTSFGYFEAPDDDACVLRNVCASLRPGGAFVIDLHGKETIARIFQPRGWDSAIVDGQEVFLLEEREPVEAWDYMMNRWVFVGPTTRREWRLKLRLYSARELTELALASGFTQATAFGSWAGDPYGPDARRLVVVARK